MILNVTYFCLMFAAFQYLSLRTKSIDTLCFQPVSLEGAAGEHGPTVLPGSVHGETPLASAYFLTMSSRATTVATYADWLGISPANLSPVISRVLSSIALTPTAETSWSRFAASAFAEERSDAPLMTPSQKEP